MTAQPERIHRAAQICPIEHDPERNRLQRALLNAALDYFLIDQRCCAFFGGAQGAFSGVYANPQAKALELEQLSEAARDKLMAACADLLRITSRRKRVPA